MEKNHQKPLLQFPCDFTIKVFGLANDTFEMTALDCIRKHAAFSGETAIKNRHSSDGKYLALTVTVHVESQAQLDAIYRELTSNPQILMAL
jgi:uncharacterized protein